MKPVIHWLLVALRLIFGAWFVFAGLNDLLHFWQPPAPARDATKRRRVSNMPN